MKTICITSFHPLISRNILMSPLLGQLANGPDTRIVLFVPDYKRAYFEREFASEQTVVVGIDMRLPAFDWAMRELGLILLETRSMAIRRHWESVPKKRYLVFWLRSMLAWIFAGRRWAFRLVRWLDASFGSRGRFGETFREYQPALLFSTDVQHEMDLACMREARDFGIPVVGMTRSWDNLTGKGLLRFVPDALVVQNDLLRDEVVRYHNIDIGRVRVVGIPHYDRYLQHKPPSREAFCKDLGFDSSRPLILFTPIGDRHIRNNVTDRMIMDMLVRAHDDGTLPSGTQVLVRFPPTIHVSMGDFITPSWMHLEQPGVGFSRSSRNDSELNEADDLRLIDSLASCDLVLTGPSTIAIDSALADKPIVLIGFDNGGKGYWESIRAWYDYSHFQPILASGGAHYAKDEAACLEAIKTYLAHPQTDRAGRRRIIEEQCGRLDGKSSERLRAVLAEYIR